LKPLEDILNNINQAIERYETCKLGLVHDQSEIARTISANLHWLTEWRVYYHAEWMSVYFETSGTNASKEREADYRVPELYKIRQFMTSGSKVLDSLRSTISVNKQ
jgi:hypothetical protein